MTSFKELVKLFVYGTLKRGGRNHHAIADTVYLGESLTSANYLLVDLGPYPGMIEKPLGGFAIHGELFEIPSALLSELDKIEGSPTLFEVNPITLNDGTKAFSYLYKRNTANARLITTCNWQTI